MLDWGRTGDGVAIFGLTWAIREGGRLTYSPAAFYHYLHLDRLLDVHGLVPRHRADHVIL